MKWISVENELPKDMKVVMVCCKIDYKAFDIPYLDVEYGQINSWNYFGQFNRRVGWNIFFCPGFYAVTHWMPCEFEMFPKDE